jgi:hypothetical protein
MRAAAVVMATPAPVTKHSVLRFCLRALGPQERQ